MVSTCNLVCWRFKNFWKGRKIDFIAFWLPYVWHWEKVLISILTISKRRRPIVMSTWFLMSLIQGYTTISQWLPTLRLFLSIAVASDLMINLVHCFASTHWVQAAFTRLLGCLPAKCPHVAESMLMHGRHNFNLNDMCTTAFIFIEGGGVMHTWSNP